MIALRLVDIAAWCKGHLHGEDVAIDDVAIDSRRVKAGALFVALHGAHHDAHDFAADAVRAGASALLVARELPIKVPQVVVADTERALGDIARRIAADSRARIVGITGSNGKTTVKTLLASILALHGATHVNAGNYNNEIGLPLTLLAMPPASEFAVLEMGAGKPGDIAYLAGIAQPDVALVNNVAAAHLERMGTLQGVAETKGAIYRALAADGIAVINADDAFAEYFGILAAPRRVVTFGLLRRADVSAGVDQERIAEGRFRLLTPKGNADIVLPLPGRHNVMNALAASALAIALGVPVATIKAGLESASSVAGRLVRARHASGATIIDDSYNANPGSFAAAIATLASEQGEQGERILVVGDMAELGTDAERLHADVGGLARRSGISRLFAVGPLSSATVAAFGKDAAHFESQQALIDALRAALRAGVTVLVKGSRSSAMDRVVAAIMHDGSGKQGARHVA